MNYRQIKCGEVATGPKRSAEEIELENKPRVRLAGWSRRYSTVDMSREGPRYIRHSVVY
jgi:hypothetical protein